MGEAPRPLPSAPGTLATYIDSEPGGVVREVAACGEAPARDQHLKQRLRIAGEVQLRRVQLLGPRLELLLY